MSRPAGPRSTAPGAPSPAAIAERIAGGIERGREPDGVLDFGFELADLPDSGCGVRVLGSTTLGCLPIRPARWFVERCRAAGDAVNLASHFMHEWMHLSGFYHWPDNAARGDAAYVVGRLVRERLEGRHAPEIDPAITALMHDVETDCGCRGNPPGGTHVGGGRVHPACHDHPSSHSAG